MHSKSNITEFLTYDSVNNVDDQIFESLLSRCKVGLKASMRGSSFIFDSVQLLYYKCHKINFKRGGSFIRVSRLVKKQKKRQ